MAAKNEEIPFKSYPGRSREKAVEDRPQDKHGRSLMTQHDPQGDWGRNMENGLSSKRVLRRSP